MKELIAIVRMNMMNKTKQALADAGLGSITARMPWAAARALLTCNFSKVPNTAMKRPSPSWVRASG
jgi:hypothetical protein